MEPEKRTSKGKIISILFLIFFLSLQGHVEASVLGGWDQYMNWQCSRNGDTVTCSSNQQQKWGCNTGTAPQKYDFCAEGGLGDDLTQDIQSRLGEAGTLTQEEKQSFYNSLTVSGECRFSYLSASERTAEGMCGSPAYSKQWQSYSAIDCSPISLGTCQSVTVTDACGDAWTAPQQIKILLGGYGATGSNDLGSCTITGTLSKVEIPTTTSTYLTLDIKPSPTAKQGDSVEFWARLFDSSGSVLLGKTLKFYVGGTYVDQGSNSATGWVSTTYSTSGLSAGSHTVKVVFDGDSSYGSSEKTQTLTITSPSSEKTYVLALYVYDSATFDQLEDAEVWVDNFLKSTVNAYGSPEPNIYLTPNSYSIKISKDGCTDASFSVTMPMQETKNVAMDCATEQVCDGMYLDEYRCEGYTKQKKYQNSNCTYSWIDVELKSEYCGYCEPGYLDEYRCSGYTKQKKYQNEDCTYEWEDIEYSSVYCGYKEKPKETAPPVKEPATPLPSVKLQITLPVTQDKVKNIAEQLKSEFVSYKIKRVIVSKQLYWIIEFRKDTTNGRDYILLTFNADTGNLVTDKTLLTKIIYVARHPFVSNAPNMAEWFSESEKVWNEYIEESSKYEFGTGVAKFAIISSEVLGAYISAAEIAGEIAGATIKEVVQIALKELAKDFSLKFWEKMLLKQVPSEIVDNIGKELSLQVGYAKILASDYKMLAEKSQELSNEIPSDEDIGAIIHLQKDVGVNLEGYLTHAYNILQNTYDNYWYRYSPLGLLWGPSQGDIDKIRNEIESARRIENNVDEAETYFKGLAAEYADHTITWLKENEHY